TQGTKTTISDKKNLLSMEAGSYRLIARSAQTCESDTSNEVVIGYSADTTLTISPTSAVTINRGASTELNASGSAGTITWSPDIAINTISGLKVVVSPNRTTDYTATLTTLLGCTVQRTKTVSVNDVFESAYNKLLT